MPCCRSPIDLAGGYEIGALVHNAAVQPMGAVGETSVADWIEALRVNVLAADVLAGAFHGRAWPRRTARSWS